MSYKNGKDILPEEVLSQIQRYFSGGIIYIPSPDKPKEWGTETGIKEQLRKRNFEIKAKKDQGYSIEELMMEYHLSYDSIKRIVYGN